MNDVTATEPLASGAPAQPAAAEHSIKQPHRDVVDVRGSRGAHEAAGFPRAWSRAQMSDPELDEQPDRRRPYLGQTLIYNARTDNGTSWPPSEPIPAIVLRISEDDDHVDLLVLDGPGERRQHYVPRRTDQNLTNSWSFNDDDELNYRPGVDHAE